MRIALKAAFTFLVLHVLVRVSGKRTVRSGGPFDFVLSLVIGDLVDNVIWSEVPPAQFVAAVLSLVALHVTVSLLSFHAAARVEGMGRE